MESPYTTIALISKFEHSPCPQYELEEGELEAVVDHLWREADPSLGVPATLTQLSSVSSLGGFPDNILSPEEAYITLPRSDNMSPFSY